MAGGPDDAVGALADGEDGGLVLGGDLEHVAEDVVLDEAPAVAQRRLDVIHHPAASARPLLRRRPAARAGVRHLRVRRLRPAVHRRIWIAPRKGAEGKVGWRWAKWEFVAARFGRFRGLPLF